MMILKRSDTNLDRMDPAILRVHVIRINFRTTSCIPAPDQRPTGALLAPYQRPTGAQPAPNRRPTGARPAPLYRRPTGIGIRS